MKATELIKLQRLKESGILTQDEFNTLKNRILSDEANTGSKCIIYGKSYALDEAQNFIENGDWQNAMTNIKESLYAQGLDTKTSAQAMFYIMKYYTKNGVIPDSINETPLIDTKTEKPGKIISEFISKVNETKQYSNATSIRCPNCGSTNVKKISATKRLFSAELFGLASSSIGKQFQCMEKNCGYKW